MRAIAICLTTLTIGGPLAGCGMNQVNSANQGVVAVPVDCSRSVRGNQVTWDHQIAMLASEVLPKEQTLLVGCFAGRRTGVAWLPEYRGSDLPAMTGGATARHKALEKWGLALEPIFRKHLDVRQVEGTDWLSALRASAHIRGVRDIYLFSDLVQQAEGIDLTKRLNPSELRAIAQTWAPQLASLAGKTVVEIGGGEKLSGKQPDTQGVDLMQELAQMAGFKVEILSTLA